MLDIGVIASGAATRLLPCYLTEFAGRMV
jgi:hypothetical protein